MLYTVDRILSMLNIQMSEYLSLAQWIGFIRDILVCMCNRKMKFRQKKLMVTKNDRYLDFGYILRHRWCIER